MINLFLQPLNELGFSLQISDLLQYSSISIRQLVPQRAQNSFPHGSRKLC